MGDEIHSFDYLDALLKHTTDAIMIADRQGKPLLFNATYAQVMKEALGLEMRPGIQPHKLLDNPAGMEFWDRAHERVLRGETFTVEYTHHIEGTMHYFSVSFTPIRRDGEVVGFSEITRDISDRRRAEQELQRAERLESLGVLAGGIAHDFNNLIGAMFASVELARLHLDEPDRARADLDNALTGFSRLKGLTTQLLTFARGGTPAMVRTSVGHIVEESARFTLGGSNVRAALEIAKDLPEVQADPGQLSQVIGSLLLNARQAVSGESVVRIVAEKAVVDGDGREELPPGTYVKITVSDKGAGIPKEALSKVFDPFFTTKQQGTGLGLATSYSIVKSHGGSISITSREGLGTDVTVLLPASTMRQSPVNEASTGAAASTGRVLVMDDEPLVLGSICGMVESLGYVPVPAARGEEAVELYVNARDEDPFVAVFLDLTIVEGMNGVETIARLRELDPAVRAIVISGYSDSDVLARPEEYGFRAKLSKPFRRSEIADTLAQVLAAAPPANRAESSES